MRAAPILVLVAAVGCGDAPQRGPDTGVRDGATQNELDDCDRLAEELCRITQDQCGVTCIVGFRDRAFRDLCSDLGCIQNVREVFCYGSEDPAEIRACVNDISNTTCGTYREGMAALLPSECIDPWWASIE